MILILNRTSANKQAAQYLSENLGMPVGFYPRQKLEDVKGEHLILLDVSATGDVQKNLAGNFLADWLIENGLPPTIKTIDLYLSEVNTKTRVNTFAYHLQACLKDKYQRLITVRYASHPDYDYTLIIPPSDSHSTLWQIYGFQKEASAPFNKTNLNSITAVADKNLLFTGKNLTDWLNKPIRRNEAKDLPLTEYAFTDTAEPINWDITEPSSKTELISSQGLFANKANFSNDATIKQQFITLLQENETIKMFLKNNTFLLQEMGAVGQDLEHALFPDQARLK